MILIKKLRKINLFGKFTCCGWIWWRGATAWALGIEDMKVDGGRLWWYWGCCRGGRDCGWDIIGGPCNIDPSYE